MDTGVANGFAKSCRSNTAITCRGSGFELSFGLVLSITTTIITFFVFIFFFFFFFVVHTGILILILVLAVLVFCMQSTCVGFLYNRSWSVRIDKTPKCHHATNRCQAILPEGQNTPVHLHVDHF